MPTSVRLDAWRRRRRIERAFQGRESLTPETFYETYFLKKGFPLSVVAGVRDVLETQLSADLSRLVDTDDFSKNLSFFWSFDSMADVEVVCALEERFHIEISDDEALNAHTVEDIVSLVHKKTGVQGQP
ncbi:acyl carrier protein [Pseudoduganella sp. R-34]|uniref:acyl carrier protein n=1 Tax=Pseudoduganella sp. R-34 TaxID=3404062 RepID=UPI003CF76B51